MSRQNEGRRHPFGFTLLEVVIAILIIGVIAAIAVPAASRAIASSRVEQAKMDLAMLSNALLQLAWDTGQWPGGYARNAFTSVETWDLSTATAGLLAADAAIFQGWKGPYVSSIPLDPWGVPYFFDPDYTVSNTMKVVVGSFGPNKVGRNLYDADDIYVVLGDSYP